MLQSTDPERLSKEKSSGGDSYNFLVMGNGIDFMGVLAVAVGRNGNMRDQIGRQWRERAKKVRNL